MGFTFFEVILVVVIMAVLLGSSFPLIRKNIKSTFFKSSVNKVYLLLDYAKTQSILRKVILTANCRQEDKAIFLTEKGKESEKLLEINIPEGIDFESEPEGISFYPDGTSQEFEMSIFDKKGREALISSQGFDGKIRVKNKKSKESTTIGVSNETVE